MQILVQLSERSDGDIDVAMPDYPVVSARGSSIPDALENAKIAMLDQWKHELNFGGKMSKSIAKLDYWLNKSRADQLLSGYRIIDVNDDPRYVRGY